MRDLFSKLVRYFLTGGVAAIVDAGAFALLFQLGLGTLPAAAASFAAAALVNFTLTSKFVFRRRPTASLFIAFLTAALGGLAVNVGVTVLAAQMLQIDPRLAKLIGIGVAFFVNFLLNVHVVFRARPGPAD